MKLAKPCTLHNAASIHITTTSITSTLYKQFSQSQMQISTFFRLFLSSFLYATIHGFAPAPSPLTESDTTSLSSVQHYPASPALSFNYAVPSSAPEADRNFSSDQHLPPSPAPSFDPTAAVPVPVMEEDEEKEREKSGDEIVPSGAATEEVVGSDSETLKWCTVREEYEECQYLIRVLDQSDGYTWQCVQRDTTQECLDSIKKGEADIINLEAGLAYTAFLNYSMKAIANEVYCGHAQSYEAVAVVNRKACQGKEGISLRDFEGQKSCHGSYSTAAGWNYPINQIKESFDSGKVINDHVIASSFFSEVCAPSEIEGLGNGLCTGCGNENGSCHSNSLYFGDSGAFRCLVEELGDIAFVKGDTALLYSTEGPHNQSWSSKSVRDFMYLCPQGGCREINGYPGSCSLGTVPANVIMASNSIPNKKRLFILQSLTNSTRINALYDGNIGRVIQLISPSTQELVMVKKLTRSYLGKSAFISQRIQELNNPEHQVIPSTVNSVSDVTSSSPCPYNISLVITFVLVFTITELMEHIFTPKQRGGLFI